MISRTYVPQPPLSDFIELFWYQEGYAPGHAKERALPEGTVELIVNLREDVLPVFERQEPTRFRLARGSLLYGAHSEFFVIDTSIQASILGVHFKPGGVFPFLNMPADELHNAVVPLDALWGVEADHLREQLLEANTLENRFHLLEQFLIARAVRPLGRHPAVALAVKALQNASQPRPVEEVTAQIGLSQRRFSQVFREAVGLTPKLFHRVQRFQAVVRQIGSRQTVDWADVALNCGYYDQAHFIHDFRDFSGLNPTNYLTQRIERLNHVPIYD